MDDDRQLGNALTRSRKQNGSRINLQEFMDSIFDKLWDTLSTDIELDFRWMYYDRDQTCVD